MAAIVLLVEQQPGWAWLALAAILLATELATGSGYLLWPSASAGLVGVLSLVGAPLNLAMQIVLFAVLTIAATYAARRWLPRRVSSETEVDINDTRRRLIGCEGEGVAGGHGRVFVDGKEWGAEFEDGGEPQPGQKVRVVAMLGGSRLKVTPI
jgi:hypothetical protein